MPPKLITCGDYPAYIEDNHERRLLKGLMRKKLPHRRGLAYKGSHAVLAAKRTTTASKGNFVNRGMKPAIIAKKVLYVAKP
jgi:hypothetical protein